MFTKYAQDVYIWGKLYSKQMFVYKHSCVVCYVNSNVPCIKGVGAGGRRFLPYKPGEDGSSLTSRGKTVPPLQAGERWFLPYTL